MEAARAAGIQRVVYAASSSCYGIPDGYPTAESAEIRPQYPYALTKYVGELVALHWSKVYRIPTVALRLFNVFGVRSRTSGAYGSVFGVFLAQKLAGKPFTVVGDGTQSRDFTYVTDVARAFVMAAESTVTGEAINIGSGRPQTVNQLVALLGGDVVNVPKRPGEPDSTHADTTKAARLLNWRTQVTFDQGVRYVLDNIDYWRAAPVWDEQSIANATKIWFDQLGETATA
jgi:UDP-glucose 4-epimerase